MNSRSLKYYLSGWNLPPSAGKFSRLLLRCAGGDMDTQNRPLEWRRRQLDSLLRMLDENEDAMVDALNVDLHRNRFTSCALELWDIVGQVD